MKNRILLCVGLMLALVSCGNNKYSLLSEDGSTFLVNGIPATEGHEKIIKSLEDMGFKKKPSASTDFLELSAIALKEEQLNKLTGGIFNNLPSTTLSDLTKKGDFQVSVTWNPSGTLHSFSIKIGNVNLPDADKAEINNRLSEIFNCPSPISVFGSKLYKNKSDVMIYCFDDHLELSLVKVDKESLMEKLDNLSSSDFGAQSGIDSVIVGGDDDAEVVVVGSDDDVEMVCVD